LPLVKHDWFKWSHDNSQKDKGLRFEGKIVPPLYFASNAYFASWGKIDTAFFMGWARYRTKFRIWYRFRLDY